MVVVPKMVDVVAIAMMEADDVFPLKILLLPQELLQLLDDDDDNDDTTMIPKVPKRVSDMMPMQKPSRAYQQSHDDPK